ncbi:MAG TPA: class I tRNA ligase family protein, partial [Pseudobdellovibrionaceae bacterium]|nr:class I tRNA ligase family protein [Pseudobdellovibrionaceae bacterium]
SEQWFVKMDQLASPARRAVENGTIEFIPESWTKTYLHWLSIIEDWCISRQLWWGHRIPAWHCSKCQHINVSETAPEKCEKCNSTDLHQDEDVLDTWFSSALWPFSTMGWPEETETQKTFYPTNILITGHDIIFFWVARMIMMGLEFKKDVPFRKIYIHGLVRDAQGRKMSKSLGNSIDPVEMIEKYGADSLRFTLMNHLYSGKDTKFSEQRLESYRNFMNKIWNASRFVLSHLVDFKIPEKGLSALPEANDLSVFDRWIIFKLNHVMKKIEEAMETCRFSDASNALYHFIWHEFCDWYIEFSKPILNGSNPKEKEATQLVLAQVLNRWIRLLHPFCPYITEAIYEKLPLKNQACMIDTYPTRANEKNLLSLGTHAAEQEVDLLKEVIEALRNIRGENRISPAQKINVRLGISSETVQKILSSNREALKTLARIDDLQVGEEGLLTKCAVTPITLHDHSVKVIVPLEGLVDFNEEIKRLEKTIEKLSREVNGLGLRLTNEKFLANADPEIVEQDKLNLVKMKGQLISMQDSLVRFRT